MKSQDLKLSKLMLYSLCQNSLPKGNQPNLPYLYGTLWDQQLSDETKFLDNPVPLYN